MEKLTEIYNELIAMGALIFHGSYDLSGSCDSTTIKVGGRFGVFMDDVKIRTRAQELDAASHEWAHIVSDATYGVDAPAAVRMKAETRSASGSPKIWCIKRMTITPALAASPSARQAKTKMVPESGTE